MQGAAHALLSTNIGREGTGIVKTLIVAVETITVNLKTEIFKLCVVRWRHWAPFVHIVFVVS